MCNVFDVNLLRCSERVSSGGGVLLRSVVNVLLLHSYALKLRQQLEVPLHYDLLDPRSHLSSP